MMAQCTVEKMYAFLVNDLGHTDTREHLYRKSSLEAIARPEHARSNLGVISHGLGRPGLESLTTSSELDGLNH